MSDTTLKNKKCVLLEPVRDPMQESNKRDNARPALVGSHASFAEIIQEINA